MHTYKFSLTLSMLACSVLAHASGKDHPTDANAPVLLAVAEPTIPSVHVMAGPVEANAGSAGIAASLPEQPSVDARFSIRAVLQPAYARPTPTRVGVVTAQLPDAPNVSLLEASPLAGMARRIGAQHFNTEDGSDVDAFTICYRLSKRASLQVIPGDPAPVKIPVTTMANNKGVTVGMVVRLSKNR